MTRPGYSEFDVLSRLALPGQPNARVPVPDLVLLQELVVAQRTGLAEGQMLTMLPKDGSGATRVFLGRLTEAGVARLEVARRGALEARARALCHAQCVCGFLAEGDDADAWTSCATPEHCQDWQAWLPHAEAGLDARGKPDDPVA